MDVFKTLILDTPTVEGATGTVTSVDLTAGTGISVSGGPITSSGSITVTNTSPDQTVALTGGTGISTSGTYPNFTITNDAPDQTVSIAAGTGISTSGSYPSFTVTNSAPDQTVSIASGTGISVTGTYPSFTVTNSSPSLGGDVVGPASATDNAVVRFDSTTGKLVQNSGVSISDANLLTTTALTVNDNTTLGSSNTDTVTFNARSASEFTPATDDTYDLGRVGHEWRDLFIDGTANIDSLVADTADVNGGTIDGATIGATTASSGAFTTLSASDDVNFDSGTLFVDASADSVGIGTTSPSAKLDVNGNVAVTGDISDSKGEIRLIPQNSKSAAYTLVLSDAGKHILHPSADTTARTFTIPANSSVAYPIGTAVTFVNQNAAGVVTIAITTDTMRLAGAGTTGSRTLAANGVATAIKITSTEWIISGTGLT